MKEQIEQNKLRAQQIIKDNIAKQLNLVIQTNRKVLKKGVTIKGQFDMSDPRILSMNAQSEYVNVEELKSSANFSIKDYKDSYFLGEINMQSNQREGIGICVYKNGRYFEGSWH